MLRRLIDVLCVAVIAAVITFSVKGREEYVTALNWDGVEILSYLNIPNKIIFAGNSDATETRTLSEEEHNGTDGSAYLPIYDDGFVPSSDTGRLDRCEHHDGQGDRCEYDALRSEEDALQGVTER